MLIRVVPILATLVALIVTMATTSAVPTEAAPQGGVMSPVPTGTNTVAPTATSTVAMATATATTAATATPLPFPDLAVSMTTSVAGTGTTTQQITHTIEVRNLGGVSSGFSTTLSIPVPEGASFAFANACNSPDAAGNVICFVQPLQPGGVATYQVVFNSTGATSQIVTFANLDPNRVIFNDVNLANNTAVVVTPVTQTTFVTGVPTSTPVPTSTTGTATTPIPTVIVVTATTIPGEPSPTVVVPPPTPQPEAGFRWIRILAPTEAVSTEDEVLWIAQPGELYYVVMEEGGWVLAIWEGDTPFWQVWIRLDTRVQSLILDRPGPGASIGQLWLVVFAPTQAYSITMDPMWIASPGEWYRVTLIEADWALGVWENDPPEFQVWIQNDNRVELTVLDLPGPTGRV